MKPPQSVRTLLLFALVTCFTACSIDLGERGNGTLVTTEFEQIGDFNIVSLSGSFDVTLRESNQPNLIIITDENLVDYIEAENANGVLDIRSTRKLRPSDNSKLIIEYTKLDRIDVSGSASLMAENTIEGERLELLMSGAGEVDLTLELNSLFVDVSGAGAVQLKGYVKEQEISMSGAGGYDGGALESERCEVSISGVGGARVFVTDELNANVSGVGGVSYRGNPPSVNKTVSGLGSIEADNDASM